MLKIENSMDKKAKFIIDTENYEGHKSRFLHQRQSCLYASTPDEYEIIKDQFQVNNL